MDLMPETGPFRRAGSLNDRVDREAWQEAHPFG
jgi:hypothetical protein